MDDHGHEATSPWQMPRAAWIAVAKRTWAETSSDNIGLIAAGVAFYGFVALMPMLGAVVLLYGLAAEPATVMRDMTQLTSVMPADVSHLIGEQLMNLVKTSDGKKGLGLLLALSLALFGARNGAGALITALNIAYEEEESRGFVRVNLLALGMTTAAALVAIIALVAIAALGHLEALVPNAPDLVLVLGKIGVYLAMTLAGAAGAATLYRYGPSRKRARWTWLTPGSIFAALLWLALTIGFGIYVANFGNYNATYGSLGAVVVTLTWLYLSSYILLFGAELNSELEHQTAEDTTRGHAPLGGRGAWVADHIATASASASVPAKPTASTDSASRDYAAGRLAGRVAPVVGLPGIGWKASIASTLGLSLLRRGQGAAGVAVLGAAAAAVWVGRERPPAPDLAIRAVFFDVDGTLVDSNDAHAEIWHDVFAEYGVDIDLATIRGQIGKGGDQLIPAMLPDASDDVVETLSDRHGELFKDRRLDDIQPFANAAALLRHVERSGRHVVLASSADATEVDHYVKLLDVAQTVHARTTTDDAATSKPAGDIFAAALDKVAGLKPSQVIVVGDTPYDVQAASACGIRTVAVRSGGFDDAVLWQAGAIAIYDDAAALLAGFDASPLNAANRS